ncbi:MAG: Hpt domain-containing protein [Proteobacteria bacterium]|nr:Hpt domain-containing protein [Pseudomonadota bacterium]
MPERLEAIEQAWATVEAVDWSGDALMPLFRAAHSLAGAGATFGFPEVGTEARRLADEVLIYLKGRRPKSPDGAARIAPLIAAVGKSLPPALPPENRPRPKG